ncbi:MAG: AAA family ATPase [Clostridia bacterium]|nr:AAA family ATPase [Clostridia bacterium]
MQINSLKINGFGNLKNKEIELKNGINLIYGKNESGKSTLLKFIYCMLYGASKNKNGKEVSDYEKYIPWVEGEYSGKITYELDNKEKYEVFREFGKKNPKIFNEKLEDISKTFNSNKTKGIEFFYEQTKIDEELFKNTVMVEQGESKLDKASQNILIQKITNLISTGSDNISYKKAIDKLNKKILEEVGTERTIGRPKNLIEEKIKQLENKKINIEKNKEELKLIEKEKININSELENLENKIKLLKEIKIKKETEKIEEEKIKTNEQIKNELNEKLNNLKLELKEEKIEKNNNIKNYIFVALIILTATIGIILKNKFIFIGVAIEIILFLIYFILEKNKNKKQLEKIKEENNRINSQIKLLEENQKEIENKIKNIFEEINNEKERTKLELKNNYFGKIEEYLLENYLDKNYEKILQEINNEENKINNLKIKQNTLLIEKNKLENTENNLEELEKNINEAYQEKEKILSLENSIKIAKNALEVAYERAKQNITPEFINKLKECINRISGGKYKNVNFNDENGLRIEMKNGNYISVENLSMGTIDQMYLSLRMNAINEIIEEKLPIILDEVFAYYDNERMENILKYLANEFKNFQIIIFTCSNREEQILSKANVEFNKIQM